MSPAAEQSLGSTVPQAASACTMLATKRAVCTPQDTHHPKPFCWTQGRPAHVVTVCDTRFVFGTAQESAGHLTQRGTSKVCSTSSAMLSDSSAASHSHAGSSCSRTGLAPQALSCSYLQAEIRVDYWPIPHLLGARLPQLLGTQGVSNTPVISSSAGKNWCWRGHLKPEICNF